MNVSGNKADHRAAIRAARAYVKRHHPHLPASWLSANAPRLGLEYLDARAIRDVVASAAFAAERQSKPLEDETGHDWKVAMWPFRVHPKQVVGTVVSMTASAIAEFNSLTTIHRPATRSSPERLPEPLCDPPLDPSAKGSAGTLLGYPVKCVPDSPVE